MAKIRPFKGVRPRVDIAAKLASPPYDVLNSQEAREMAEGNPVSFLHCNKPEIDLPPETNPYDDAVYNKGRENLDKFITDGHLRRDPAPCFYLYAQEWVKYNHKQVGLVVGASVQEYIDDKIKKHELTRKAKEEDRIKLIDVMGAQVGPVFLTYKARPEIDAELATIMETDPVYDFEADDGIRHTLWVISSKMRIEMITRLFEQVPELYVADGHHRSASANILAQRRREAKPDWDGSEPWNIFLAVLFPHDQLKILSYNRVVADLNGLSKEEFLAKVEEKFYLSKSDKPVDPERPKLNGMYLDKQWYRLEAKETTYDANDPVESLDVAILQNNLLSPVLGIGDPRTDDRIDFIGGIRGLEELERRVNNGEMTVAFSMHATTIEQLMAIADAGMIMPPKSTWFEPKLRSGIVCHLIDDRDDVPPVNDGE